MKRHVPVQCLDMSGKENFIVSVIMYLLFVSCSNMTPPPLDLYKCSSDQLWTGWLNIRAPRRLWTMSSCLCMLQKPIDCQRCEYVHTTYVCMYTNLCDMTYCVFNGQ